MRKMKKMASFILAMIMAVMMVLPATAAETQVQAVGEISISGVNAHETYTGYKIFDVTYSLNSDDTKNLAYHMKADSPVKALVEEYTYSDKKIFTLTPNTANNNVLEVAIDPVFNTPEAAADFAEYLSAELPVIELPETATGKTAADIKSNGEFVDILTNYTVQDNITEKVNNGQQIIYWENLSFGYWFVTTTTGTLCNLNTAAPTVAISDKNEDVTIEKEVKEDSTKTWGETNSAQIGDTVEFKTTVHAKKGATNYVVYDRLYDGDSEDGVAFTLNKESIEVFVDTNRNGVKDAGETVLRAKENTEDTEYDYELDTNNPVYVKGSVNYICDFKIAFHNDYLETITDSTDIVITYSALLDKGAAIENDGYGDDYNTNDTWITYGHGSESEWDQTKTYTLFFDLIKIDGSSKYLPNAQFELYYDEACENKVLLVDEGSSIYRVATENENITVESSAIIVAGHADISGLDKNTTYYLKEVKAPAGYNMVDGIIKVEIGENSLSSTFDRTLNGDTWNSELGGIAVVNLTGTELPSTGGMGTTLFYVVGGILVLAAVVVFVTKKRMSVEE